MSECYAFRTKETNSGIYVLYHDNFYPILIIFCFGANSKNQRQTVLPERLEKAWKPKEYSVIIESFITSYDLFDIP